MATVSLQTHCSLLQFRYSLSKSHRRSPGRLRVKVNDLAKQFSAKVGIFAAVEGGSNLGGRDGFPSLFCFCKMNAEIEKVEDREEKEERPAFDINLAVILAGFAFEAYSSPPENIGRQEVDAANCKTIYLSESFVREIYDGQLFIKLKRGFDLPVMDPWGTSDPYVVMQLDSQVVKSKIKWGKKEPIWNEDFVLNIKLHPIRVIQVAAWDANLVTPHKRMGNAAVSLDCLCDGNLHEVLVELEGMGGGGKIQLEFFNVDEGVYNKYASVTAMLKGSSVFKIKYKSFEEIDKQKEWWRVPFVSELLQRYGLDSALRKLFGSETVPARQFVEYAFGQLKSFNDVNALRDRLFKGYNKDSNKEEMTSSDRDVPDISLQTQTSSEVPSDDTSQRDEKRLGEISPQKATTESGQAVEPMTTVNKPVESDQDFWKDFSYILNQNVVQKLGLPVPEKLKWDGLDILNKVGLQSQKMAEAGYIESGLATPEEQNLAQDKQSDQQTKSSQSPLPDIKKATQDLLRQTDSVFGALMVLAATVSELNKGGQKNEQEEHSASEGENDFSRSPALEKLPQSQNGSVLDDKKAEEMRALFLTAESAMEAWAMLSTSLGHPSFIKSEFEKVCFLDNATTDTQAAIWRDSARRRLVVAFRGTEQAKWKDLLTDLMLVPAGLNPERIGGDFKQELQVHSGFLSAYDSVRMRIISLIKLAIGYTDEASDATQKWNAYVTGHSLGGALATLLSVELSSSQLAKSGAISVTMYNFGSPRVGNRRFADVYNEKVKDSWRVVNHRDIIPTVPRLMGYCHVAQPVYLAPGELKDALEEMDLWRDGYQGDVIGEYTPDVLVTEFMKGEKELIEKILQTEINIFRAIRDGSALMQHMEDFYYITLLESVRSNYQTIASTARN